MYKYGFFDSDSSVCDWYVYIYRESFYGKALAAFHQFIVKFVFIWIFSIVRIVISCANGIIDLIFFFLIFAILKFGKCKQKIELR